MKSTANPKSRLSASICCRISRWTTTSSAVVGSSITMSSGRSASAIAMITRWRIPPESSCGYARARRRSMPTSSSSSPARTSARRRSMRSCARIASTNWSPTRMTGLSAFIALCNTIDTLRQRKRRSSSALFSSRFSPWKRMLPPVIRAGGRRICMTEFAIVLLPQPDSPARPTVSPSRIARSTPSTARAGISPKPYSTVRPCSSSSIAARVCATVGSSATAVTTSPSAAGAPRARSGGAGC